MVPSSDGAAADADPTELYLDLFAAIIRSSSLCFSRQEAAYYVAPKSLFSVGVTAKLFVKRSQPLLFR